jgi:hypothetical protein
MILLSDLGSGIWDERMFGSGIRIHDKTSGFATLTAKPDSYVARRWAIFLPILYRYTVAETGLLDLYLHLSFGILVPELNIKCDNCFI